jgi:hypothetical protein
MNAHKRLLLANGRKWHAPKKTESLVRRTYRMNIESDIVERVNRAASTKQLPIRATKKK